MGALDQDLLLSNTNYNWMFESGNNSNSGGIWTKEENKAFEKALAIYDEKTPDRWLKVAALIPGKSVWDVVKQYEELIEDVSDIEAGLVPIPGYVTSPFTLDLVNGSTRFDPFRKRSPVSFSRPCDHERKKGVPWTEDEHRRFLLGLQKHGKGDWRNISRNFVRSKTATQVASHAQKYFLRQNSGGKDKRRPSIHDITTANFTDTTPKMAELDQKPSDFMPKVLLDWSNHNGEAFMIFGSNHGMQNHLYNNAAYVGSS